MPLPSLTSFPLLFPSFSCSSQAVSLLLFKHTWWRPAASGPLHLLLALPGASFLTDLYRARSLTSYLLRCQPLVRPSRTTLSKLATHIQASTSSLPPLLSFSPEYLSPFDNTIIFHLYIPPVECKLREVRHSPFVCFGHCNIAPASRIVPGSLLNGLIN